MGNRQVRPEIQYHTVDQEIIDINPIYFCDIENSNLFLSDRTIFTPNFIFLRINHPDIKLVEIIDYVYQEKGLLFTIDPIFEYYDIRLELSLSNYMSSCVELNLNIFNNNIAFLPVMEISSNNPLVDK